MSLAKLLKDVKPSIFLVQLPKADRFSFAGVSAANEKINTISLRSELRVEDCDLSVSSEVLRIAGKRAVNIRKKDLCCK